MILFIIDLLIFTYFDKFYKPEVARMISISCSILTAWFLNRNTTFKKEKKDNKKLQELIAYYITSIFVAFINFIISIIFIKIFNVHFVISITLSCCIAASMNFYLLNKYIYK